MEMKTCASCGLEKTVESFYNRSASRPVPHSYCKVCMRQNAAKTYQKYKDDPAFKQRRYEYQLKLRLGRPIEATRRDLFERQDGQCAICGKPESKNPGKRLAVDHCHVTGTIRGLLCDNCNRGLGLLGDSLPAVLRAVRYLQAT